MGTYATVDDLRDQGAPDTMTDARLQEVLELASRYIDRVTGFFFEDRVRTYRLDGPGTPVLELPSPCHAITLLEVDDRAIPSTEYVNYNREPEGDVDDFWYPRLELKSSGDSRMDRAFRGPFYRSRNRWNLGELNVDIAGTFGFTLLSPAGTGARIAPPEIKRATIRLAAALMANAGELPTIPGGAGPGTFQSETLGNYSYSLASAVAEAVASGDAITGDPTIDGWLNLYTRHKVASG